jgi:predicted peroxiredoxin
MTTAPSATAGRPRRRYTVVIERAFRGLVEEQYGNIVWLSEALQRMGGEVTIVLVGGAARLAIDAPAFDARLRIGQAVLEDVGDYRGAILSALASGARVRVDLASLGESGLDRVRLLDGVAPMHDSELVALVAEADQTWFW